MATTTAVDYRDVTEALARDFGLGPYITARKAATLCRAFGVTYLTGNNPDQGVPLVEVAEYLAKQTNLW